MILTLESFYATCLSLGLAKNHNIIQNIWIGFSGGLDSRVLIELAYLAFANDATYKLRAVHINHSFNKNADLWQDQCYQTCKQLNIEFQAIKIQINSNYTSLEAAFRNARIAVWQKLLSRDDVLLLAHHANDQAETVFLRLLRGSGLKGLAAMREIAKIKNIKIIRPLLHNSRQEIENFAKKHSLSYVQDDSNFNQKIARNFLRHSVLPMLNNNWPKFINNINRTVKHLHQADLYISNQAKKALINCYAYNNYYYNSQNILNINILSITKLLQYDNFLQTEILREFIINQGFYPPEDNQLNKIYTEVIAAKIDRQPKLNLRQYIICRYRDHLYIYPTNFERKKASFKNIIGDLAIYVGDSIEAIGFGKAKKIFQKFGIPPWQRYDYQLVFWRKELVAILGLWCKGL